MTLFGGSISRMGPPSIPSIALTVAPLFANHEV
jgi:hypothetical protein